MAKWIVRRQDSSTYNLYYEHQLPIHNFFCGELRADTPPMMILDWILHQEATRPYDLVQFPYTEPIGILPYDLHALKS